MRIDAYIGHDWKSRMAARILRDLQLYFAREYGIVVEVSLTEIMIGDSDEEDLVPLVMMEGKVLSRGRVPSMEELVDAVFDQIVSGMKASVLGFPLLEAQDATF